MHLHDHDHAQPHGEIGGDHHISAAFGRSAGRAGNARRMFAALAINVAMVLLAVAGAALTGSLALLADAGHVFSDVLSIALGIAAARFAARPASPRGTFGLGRVEILAALVNGMVLVLVSLYIAVEAVSRFSDVHTVSGRGVLVFGVLGLAGNAAATVVLARGDRGDINLEGVLRHSFADALGSLGVIAAGGGIILTGWQPLDPIVGLAIALVVLVSSWRLIREPLNVLLERVPAGLDSVLVGEAIAGVAGVREVHDLHIWTITSGFPALAAHVTVKATDDCDSVRAAIESLLVERFGLQHTTLQVSHEQLLQIDPPLAPSAE